MPSIFTYDGVSIILYKIFIETNQSLEKMVWFEFTNFLSTITADHQVCNGGNNIKKQCNILEYVRFTTSIAEVHVLRHELPNGLRFKNLRKLKSIREIPKLVGGRA